MYIHLFLSTKYLFQFQLPCPPFLDKPSVTAVESVVHAGVGHQAILACTVHSSPEAEVVWYRGTLLLETDNRMYREVVGTRHTLVLHHVREEEFTQYRCQATNTLGTHSATVTISGIFFFCLD